MLLAGVVWELGGYVVQEAAVLLLEFLDQQPVSLGWGNGFFLSLGLWIGEGSMLWRLF